MRRPLRLLALLALVPLLAAVARAQTPLKARRIASGLQNPVWAGSPPGDDRIFIALQRGLIKVLENGSINSTNFLNKTGDTAGLGEQGLLGVAFHPLYATNGYCFVNYTNNVGDTVVSRFEVAANPGRLNPNSEQVILTQDQPFGNHNGGMLAFGPDGYLYLAFGDGGSGNDPDCNSQNLGTWHGKILRIDVDQGLPYTVPPDNPFVDTPGALPEIYHLGLRNPWRLSFDAATGDMYIGDVGQASREEIDFAPAGVAGINFGWKVKEGNKCHQTGNCNPAPAGCASGAYADPIYEMVNGGFNGPASITGGYVYRGCAIPDLVGTYIFADYIDGRVRSFDFDRNSLTVSNFQDRAAELEPAGPPTLDNISSFGEDGFGELLIVDHHPSNGEVYRIVPAGAPAAVNVVRNGGGTNALCLEPRSEPIVNNLWRARIDTQNHPGGAKLAALYCYMDSTSGRMMPGGELLVDFGGQPVFRLVQPVTKPYIGFRVYIPCDLALVGRVFHTQGVLFGGSRWAFCNALDATVGYY